MMGSNRLGACSAAIILYDSTNAPPCLYASHMFLCSCPYCACSVEGYDRLESREGFERMLALEDEGAGLRAQLERFSRRVSARKWWLRSGRQDLARAPFKYFVPNAASSVGKRGNILSTVPHLGDASKKLVHGAT